MSINKATVIAVLREEALRRAAGDEELAGMLLKAATYCDELRIDQQVTDRLYNQVVSELRSTQGILNRQIQNLGTELIGFRTDMQRYSNEIKELAAVLTKAKDAG